MKKIIPFLIIGILVLSSIGVVAVLEEKNIENKPLNKEEIELEIEIEGGLLGYGITITNMGQELITVKATLNIVTDARFMILGGNILFETCPENGYLGIEGGGYETFNTKPVFGFGQATILISGTVTVESIPPGNYEISGETTGFVFLFFVRCDPISINIIPEE